MLLMFSASVPVFEMVSVKLLACPTATLLKLSEEATEIPATMPVPDRETVDGLPDASCAMSNEAERAPVAEGVNVTVIS